jgi:lipoprotein-anchoring transpeptidase ErfK/SrfK
MAIGPANSQGSNPRTPAETATVSPMSTNPVRTARTASVILPFPFYRNCRRRPPAGHCGIHLLWEGEAQVGRKAFWPGWTPPKEMIARRPDLPDHMDGGMENPLGARALYLFKGGKDTLFRIHGTNEPGTIGRAVSSGCIRMLNADVIDPYQRVAKGTRVLVL